MNVRVKDRSAEHEACNALLRSRVRVKEHPELTGVITAVLPDKHGKPFQVHVKFDSAPNSLPSIYGPDEVEPEFLS
jgi:hypothetical protein